MPAVLALTRHEVRVLRHDPLPFVLTVVFALLLMAFLEPSYSAVFAGLGVEADGAAHVVPAMTVMFVMFLIANVAFGFIREREWRTWDRLVGAGASRGAMAAGKAIPIFAIQVVLAVLLIAMGAVLYGLRIEGSLAAIGVLVVVLAAWTVAMGCAVAMVVATPAQATAAANLVTLGLGGLGGVLTVASTLPGWAQQVGELTPTWWFMRGFQDVAAGDGVGAVWPAAVVAAIWAFLALGAAVVMSHRSKLSTRSGSHEGG